MKKLLFISNITNKITNFSYPSYMACKKLGIEFHLAANLDNFDYENNPYKDIIFHNIHCDRNPISPRNIQAFNLINKIIKEYKIDYIHCNTPIGGVLGRWCGHKNKVKKIIYTAHGFHFYKGAPLVNNLIYKSIEKFLAHYTDAVITINGEDFRAAKTFKLHNSGKVFKVNGVGINVKDYQNILMKKKEYRKSLGLKENDFVCIGIGRIEPNKNYQLNIAALKNCKKNVHLLICGEGEQKEELMEFARNHGVSSNIHFLGYREDIDKLLNISDCYLSASKREGLPRSLMEAMANGLPCIVTDIRGNRDLVVNEINGYLVKTADECSKYINKLLNNKNICKKMSDNNKKKIQAYDVANIITSMEDIYSNIF